MRLKFLKRWRSFKADQQADIADGAANVLIKRGYATEFPPAPGCENVPGVEVDVDAKAPRPKAPPNLETRDGSTKARPSKRHPKAQPTT